MTVLYLDTSLIESDVMKLSGVKKIIFEEHIENVLSFSERKSERKVYKTNINNLKCEIKTLDNPKELADILGQKSWCFYITLNNNLFSERMLIQENSDITNSVFGNDIYWHGGITFNQMNEDGTLTLGCDFQHACDQNKNYQLEDIALEMLQTALEISARFNLESIIQSNKEKEEMLEILENQEEKNVIVQSTPFKI